MNFASALMVTFYLVVLAFASDRIHCPHVYFVGGVLIALAILFANISTLYDEKYAIHLVQFFHGLVILEAFLFLLVACFPPFQSPGRTERALDSAPAEEVDRQG